MAEMQAKAGFEALKKHWVAFLVGGFVLVVAAFWYEHKNPGAVSSKLAGLPLVGKLFA